MQKFAMKKMIERSSGEDQYNIELSEENMLGEGTYG